MFREFVYSYSVHVFINQVVCETRKLLIIAAALQNKYIYLLKKELA
jgi:hypothetical protein